MIELKCQNCGRSHNRRFFFCPNCGRPLITVRVDTTHSDTLIFEAAGWSKRYLVSVHGVHLGEVKAPRLSPSGFKLRDSSGQEHGCELLTLYHEISKEGFETLPL